MVPKNGENAFIDWLRKQTPPSGAVRVGPGDDAAVLQLPDRELLVTTDMLLDGSCFDLQSAGPYRVGRKAIAVNLSDVAAMAGRPIAAFISVGLPRRSGRDIAEQLFLGLRSLADVFATPIAGGDTNSWHGPLVVSVTLLAEPVGRGPVLRRGARPGDWLMVTGPLGGSIRGKHLDFMPRVNEAVRLHELVELQAMIDISDGLAADLAKLVGESGCGARLHADHIPISDDAHAMTDGVSPLEHALGDGEDFELLFAVSPADGERLLTEQPIPGITLAHIGNCTETGLWLDQAGTRRPLAPTGYEHQFE